jgi:hypothetical protein
MVAIGLRRKVLVALFAIDTIIALAAAITVGTNALLAWIALNIVIIIPALLVRQALSKGRKRSDGGISIGPYPTIEEKKGQFGRSEYITLEGETVKSYGEKALADYFFKNNIRYQYEQPAWSRSGRRISRPDFYLPDLDVYVEYWGMADTKEPDKKEKYVSSMKWKMDKYHQNGIKFVSIYRGNLDDLDSVFRAKLRDETGIDI